MEFELQVEGVRIKAKMDTGFEGELMVGKETFDGIPFEPSLGPRVCTASMECYSSFVKLSRVRAFGKEMVVEVLNLPAIEKNLVGEAFLKKLKIVIDYKRSEVGDP